LVGSFYLLVACLLWALDTLIRYPLVQKGLNPISIVAFEHLLLTLFFLPSLIKNWSQAFELKISDGISFFMIGVVGSAFATVAFTQAFSYLHPSLVILLQKFQPIVAVLLAFLILKEPIPKPFLFWGSVSLVGGILLSSEDLLKLYDLFKMFPQKLQSSAALQGYSLVGFSIIGWGASTVFGKKLQLSGFSPQSIMQGRFLLGFLALAPFWFFGVEFIFPDYWDYGRIFVMVLLSGLIAMYFYYKGLGKLSAKSVAIMEMFFPLFAVIVNWIILHHSLAPIQIVGAILLSLGALVIQLKKY
jgi:drug/metabolite transporter (DMT)-like permease